MKKIDSSLLNYVYLCTKIGVFNWKKKIQIPNMKILIALIAISFSITLSAQNIDGTYHEGTDTITFNNNRVSFTVKSNDGLGVVFAGEGIYEMIDDFLLINTEEYSGAKTKINMKSAEKKDTIQVQFFDEQGFSIKGIRTEFLNKSGKTIDLSISNEHGIVLYEINPKVVSIKASDLLYDKTIFDCSADSDYTVHLVKNRVLEDKTVIFKLIDSTDSQLTVKLLATDFNKKNPSISHLQKLDKKTENTIDRPRIFKKSEQ